MLAIAATKRLRDITLQVDLALGAGVTALVGPSGAGKSTLLRLVAGLARPDTGTIRLNDTLLDDAARRYHAPPGRRGISLVFQEYALFPHLSAAENVAYGLRARRVGGAERRRRVAAILERLSIEELARARPGQLSGGQRQRVALARALVLEPRALLLDEPLAALDARTRAAVRAELRSMLVDLDIPTVLVTHDVADALVFRERIVVLEGGRVVQDGPHAALLANPRSPFIADFIGVNYYEGSVDDNDNALAVARDGRQGGTRRVRLTDDVVVDVPADGLAPTPGPVAVTLRPWEVTLSKERPAGSARNVWLGRVREVLPLGGRVRVTLAVGAREALMLVAEITPEARAELGVREGEPLYASFKATAVTAGVYRAP